MTCVLCRAYYWLGDRWSKLVNLIPDEWEWFGEKIVQPYFWLMRRSFVLDLRGQCGQWREDSRVEQR